MHGLQKLSIFKDVTDNCARQTTKCVDNENFLTLCKDGDYATKRILCCRSMTEN